jgi:glycosyltransferase involved in cell wall biosynthesis
MKTVAYFGNYDPGIPRNLIFIECLRLAGYHVVEINCREHGFKKYIKLVKELLRQRKRIDYLLVGFPGQSAVIIAKIFFRGPIIFNALLSLYDAMIIDRRAYSRFSLRALYFWFLDFFSVRLADCIILDCNAYIDFFVEKFKAKRSKFKRIFLGANENVFKPLPMEESTSEIHYYSSFLPSHGTDIIIKAAKILEKEKIKFVISGRGQCYERDLKLAQELQTENIKFVDSFKDANQLNKFINSSFVCLGLFGGTAKTKRAIASKVFEALCCARPVITSSFSATSELLKDKESVLLVKPNSPEDLADKIHLLKIDKELRKKIALNGRKVYEQKASFSIISRQLKSILNSFDK